MIKHHWPVETKHLMDLAEALATEISNDDKNVTYDNDVKPFLDDYRDERCNHSCEDCDCDLEKAAPSYTGHESVDEFLHKTLEVMRKKGHDYRQGNDADLIHNFRTVSEAVNEPMEKVWFTYFFKHYAALATYIKEGGQSESEPIEGRITDMIVYLLLFHEIVREKKNIDIPF